MPKTACDHPYHQLAQKIGHFDRGWSWKKISSVLLNQTPGLSGPVLHSHSGQTIAQETNQFLSRWPSIAVILPTRAITTDPHGFHEFIQPFFFKPIYLVAHTTSFRNKFQSLITCCVKKYPFVSFVSSRIQFYQLQYFVKEKTAFPCLLYPYYIQLFASLIYLLSRLKSPKSPNFSSQGSCSDSLIFFVALLCTFSRSAYTLFKVWQSELHKIFQM